MITTADTPKSSNVVTPPSNCTSCSFGITMSHNASVSSSTRLAGAGFKMVSAPDRFAAASASRTTAAGTSRCTSSTRPEAAAARTSFGFSRPFAPGTTMIEFSPLADTPMSARPVGASDNSTSELRSMESASITAINWRAASSPPTAPAKAVRAPARAAATAWFRPLPPANSA